MSRGDTSGEGPWWHVYTAERCVCILTVLINVFVLQPYCTSITGVDGSRQTNGGVDREREREGEREAGSYTEIQRHRQTKPTRDKWIEKHTEGHRLTGNDRKQMKRQPQWVGIWQSPTVNSNAAQLQPLRRFQIRSNFKQLFHKFWTSSKSQRSNAALQAT